MSIMSLYVFLDCTFLSPLYGLANASFGASICIHPGLGPPPPIDIVRCFEECDKWCQAALKAFVVPCPARSAWMKDFIE